MHQEISFTIRVDQTLKDAFLTIAKSQDRTASQLLREFMRGYVKKNGQADLLAASRAQPTELMR